MPPAEGQGVHVVGEVPFAVTFIASLGVLAYPVGRAAG